MRKSNWIIIPNIGLVKKEGMYATRVKDHRKSNLYIPLQHLLGAKGCRVSNTLDVVSVERPRS